MKTHIYRAVTTLCLLIVTGHGNIAIAADNSPAQVSPDDMQAIFQTLIYRNCQKQIKPMLDKFMGEISLNNTDESIEKRICACTTNVASKGQRMKAIFALPPDKLRDLSSDNENSAYIKGKLVSSMLQCVGYHIDMMIDPKPSQQ